jgi:hypothetical protein
VPLLLAQEARPVDAVDVDGARKARGVAGLAADVALLVLAGAGAGGGRQDDRRAALLLLGWLLLLWWLLRGAAVLVRLARPIWFAVFVFATAVAVAVAAVFFAHYFIVAAKLPPHHAEHAADRAPCATHADMNKNARADSMRVLECKLVQAFIYGQWNERVCGYTNGGGRKC